MLQFCGTKSFSVSKFFLNRAKYHKLKYGTELNQEDLKPPSLEKKEGKSSAMLLIGCYLKEFRKLSHCITM